MRKFAMICCRPVFLSRPVFLGQSDILGRQVFWGRLMLAGLSIFAGLLVTGPADVRAQGGGAQRPWDAASRTEEEAEDPARLPAPLNDITANVDALESTGYLELVETRFRPGGGIYGSDDAVVWTFRTARPITCRHLELLLKSFYDVRIYDTAFERMAEVHRTVLVHSSRIRVGAVNGRILAAGDYIDVWIHFRETDIRRLISLRADQLVFGSLPNVAERRLSNAKRE